MTFGRWRVKGTHGLRPHKSRAALTQALDFAHSFR